MKSASTTSPAPSRHHPNMKGSEPRTRLAGGPFVDTTTTLAQFTTWAAAGVSQGVIIDRLTAYALATGYNPVTETVTVPKTSPAASKGRRG